MTAPKIRADFDQLKSAAGAFAAQAQAAQQFLGAIQGALAPLQDGDWVGLGASAFYQEMDGQVLPTLNRLAAALEGAQQTTLQISQLLSDAEAEAARVLRGEGGAAQSALFAAAVAPAPAGGAGGGAGGAGGTAGAGGAGAAAPARSRRSLADTVGRMLVHDRAAVQRVLGGKFSAATIALVQKSPTLSSQIAVLENKKFTISPGTAATGSATDTNRHTIAIGPQATDAETAAMIAHEVGHATYPTDPIPADLPWDSESYVKNGVERSLRDEGRAQFNAAQARAEVQAAGGGDIGMPGTQDAAFIKAYDDYTAGKANIDQTISQMATLMGNETASPPPHLPYRDYYREQYQMIWDSDFDEPPPPPQRP